MKTPTNTAGQAPAQAQSASPAASKPAAQPRAESKRAKVIELLARPDGASVADIVEATGWLPHTTRAALTGIRWSGPRFFGLPERRL